jgi:hypothetical protein
MTDKFGTPLKVGDWIHYHFWNAVNDGGFYASKITRIWPTFMHENCEMAFFIDNEGYEVLRYDYSLEKLPSNKKEREQLIFLRKLEQ